MEAKKKKSLLTKLTKLAGIIITLAIFIAALATIFDFFDRPQKYESGSLSEKSLEKTDSLKQQEPEKKAATLGNSGTVQSEEFLFEGMVYLDKRPLTGAKVEILDVRKSTFTEDGKFEIKLIKPEILETYTFRVTYNQIDSIFTDVKHRDQKNLVFRLRKIYYKVNLLIPSDMSGAEILVDGKAATIIKRSLTVVTIRVEKKETNHRISAKKGDILCAKEQLIRQNNLILPLCE